MEGIDGRYLSAQGHKIYDHVSIVYSDFPSDWFRNSERDRLLTYLEELKQFSEAVLWQEETILIIAYPVIHVT